MESTARSALGAMHEDIMMFRIEATLRKQEPGARIREPGGAYRRLFVIVLVLVVVLDLVGVKIGMDAFF